MTFSDISVELKTKMPALRGRLLANQPLAGLTWFCLGAGSITQWPTRCRRN